MRLTKLQTQFLQDIVTEAESYAADSGINPFVEVKPHELRTARSLERRGLLVLNGDYEAKLSDAALKLYPSVADLVRSASGHG